MSKIKAKYINFDPSTLEANGTEQLALKSGLIPVKAIGTEIDAGTDDAKFATSKALKDSIYAQIHVGTSAPADVTQFWLNPNEDSSHELLDNVEETYSKTQNFAATVISYSSTATYTIALGSNQVHILTAGANFTVDVSGQVAGATYMIILKQDATGTRAVSWSANFKWPAGTPPNLDTTANAVHILSFVSDGTYLYGVGINNFS